jgi:hypothetical protein
MTRIRKVAASIFFANRFIKGALLLHAHNIKLEASGTWLDSKTKEPVFLEAVPAAVLSGSLHGKTLRAVVDGETTRLTEREGSYLYVSFDLYANKMEPA